MVPMEEFKSIPPSSTNLNLSYKEMTTIGLLVLAFFTKIYVPNIHTEKKYWNQNYMILIPSNQSEN
jgi:hypothetical protein